MNRSLKITIVETEEFLLQKLKEEKDPRRKERLHFLYLLKTNQIKSLTAASRLLGRHRHTLSEWLKKYELGGLEELLKREHSGGRPTPLSGKVLDALKEKLACPEGFGSYKDIVKWLSEMGVEMKYTAVHKACHSKLKASPKVARPYNPKQNPKGVEAFKKTSILKLNQKGKNREGIGVFKSTLKTKVV